MFYFILNTLSTENVNLLAATLAIIAEIVKDEYNREILTELGMISKISQLTYLVNIIALFLIEGYTFLLNPL